MTTFVQHHVPATTAPGSSALRRLFASLSRATAAVTTSLEFTRAMQAANTPAARLAVLDRFVPSSAAGTGRTAA